MKRKRLTAILSVCVAMAMTACGGNADAPKAEETTVMENAEVDAREEAEAKAQAEAEAKAKEEAEEQARIEEAERYYEAGQKCLEGDTPYYEGAFENFTKAADLGDEYAQSTLEDLQEIMQGQ